MKGGTRCYQAVTGRLFAGDGQGSRAVVGRVHDSTESYWCMR